MRRKGLRELGRLHRSVCRKAGKDHRSRWSACRRPGWWRKRKEKISQREEGRNATARRCPGIGTRGLLGKLEGFHVFAKPDALDHTLDGAAATLLAPCTTSSPCLRRYLRSHARFLGPMTPTEVSPPLRPVSLLAG